MLLLFWMIKRDKALVLARALSRGAGACSDPMSKLADGKGVIGDLKFQIVEINGNINVKTLLTPFCWYSNFLGIVIKCHSYSNAVDPPMVDCGAVVAGARGNENLA